MPKDLHDNLDKRARKKGFKPGTDEYNKYVYGTLKKVEKAHNEKDEIDLDNLPSFDM